MSELAMLNDRAITDDEMLMHVRQLVAQYYKQLRELKRDNKELQKKMEYTNKKTEQSEGKIGTTRQNLSEIEERLRN